MHVWLQAPRNYGAIFELLDDQKIANAGRAVRADPRPDRPQKYGLYYFGYEQAAIDILEKKKLLPLSFQLSEGGRARAWTGGQILDHRAEMQKRAEAELAAAKDQPPMPQPKALVNVRKVKKVKLRRPIKQYKKIGV